MRAGDIFKDPYIKFADGLNKVLAKSCCTRRTDSKITSIWNALSVLNQNIQEALSQQNYQALSEYIDIYILHDDFKEFFVSNTQLKFIDLNFPKAILYLRQIILPTVEQKYDVTLKKYDRCEGKNNEYAATMLRKAFNQIIGHNNYLNSGSGIISSGSKASSPQGDRSLHSEQSNTVPGRKSDGRALHRRSPVSSNGYSGQGTRRTSFGSNGSLSQRFEAKSYKGLYSGAAASEEVYYRSNSSDGSIPGYMEPTVSWGIRNGLQVPDLKCSQTKKSFKPISRRGSFGGYTQPHSDFVRNSTEQEKNFFRLVAQRYKSFKNPGGRAGLNAQEQKQNVANYYRSIRHSDPLQLEETLQSVVTVDTTASDVSHNALGEKLLNRVADFIIKVVKKEYVFDETSLRQYCRFRNIPLGTVICHKEDGKYHFHLQSLRSGSNSFSHKDFIEYRLEELAYLPRNPKLFPELRRWLVNFILSHGKDLLYNSEYVEGYEPNDEQLSKDLDQLLTVRINRSKFLKALNQLSEIFIELNNLYQCSSKDDILAKFSELSLFSGLNEDVQRKLRQDFLSKFYFKDGMFIAHPADIDQLFTQKSDYPKFDGNRSFLSQDFEEQEITATDFLTDCCQKISENFKSLQAKAKTYTKFQEISEQSESFISSWIEAILSSDDLSEVKTNLDDFLQQYQNTELTLQSEEKQILQKRFIQQLSDKFVLNDGSVNANFTFFLITTIYSYYKDSHGQFFQLRELFSDALINEDAVDYFAEDDFEYDFEFLELEDIIRFTAYLKELHDITQDQEKQEYLKFKENILIEIVSQRSFDVDRSTIHSSSNPEVVYSGQDGLEHKVDSLVKKLAQSSSTTPEDVSRPQDGLEHKVDSLVKKLCVDLIGVIQSGQDFKTNKPSFIKAVENLFELSHDILEGLSEEEQKIFIFLLQNSLFKIIVVNEIEIDQSYANLFLATIIKYSKAINSNPNHQFANLRDLFRNIVKNPEAATYFGAIEDIIPCIALLEPLERLDFAEYLNNLVSLLKSDTAIYSNLVSKKIKVTTSLSADAAAEIHGLNVRSPQKSEQVSVAVDHDTKIQQLMDELSHKVLIEQEFADFIINNFLDKNQNPNISNQFFVKFLDQAFNVLASGSSSANFKQTNLRNIIENASFKVYLQQEAKTRANLRPIQKSQETTSYLDEVFKQQPQHSSSASIATQDGSSQSLLREQSSHQGTSSSFDGQQKQPQVKPKTKIKDESGEMMMRIFASNQKIKKAKLAKESQDKIESIKNDAVSNCLEIFYSKGSFTLDHYHVFKYLCEQIDDESRDLDKDFLESFLGDQGFSDYVTSWQNQLKIFYKQDAGDKTNFKDFVNNIYSVDLASEKEEPSISR
jgi:hypothetical protein